jgi:hypothetical protein
MRNPKAIFPVLEPEHRAGTKNRHDPDKRVHDAVPSNRNNTLSRTLRLLLLIDLESKLHGDVRRERLYTPAPRGAPHAGSAGYLADSRRVRLNQPPRAVAEFAALVEVQT